MFVGVDFYHFFSSVLCMCYVGGYMFRLMNVVLNVTE